jgi:putative ABC transport system substrate-binding protein
MGLYAAGSKSLVDRRTFVSTMAIAVFAWPLVAEAQQSKVPTIGVLAVGSPGSERFGRLFRESMHELGYVEGQNVHFEFRSDQ